MTDNNKKTSNYREYHKEQMQRLRRTEGTYAFKESHRLGIPGLRKYLYNRVRDLLIQKAVLTQQEN